MTQAAARGAMVTPESALLSAIILKAVEDLTSNDDTVRFEAHEFFLQKKGPWADSRRHLFDAAGLDEEAVCNTLSRKLTPPEKPVRKWSSDDIYESMPDHPVEARDLLRSLGVRTALVTSRLQHLVKRGLVMRVGIGQYIRSDKFDAWDAKRPMPKPALAVQIESHLRDTGEALTIRQLGFVFDGDYGSDAIRTALKSLAAEGRVKCDVIEWSAVPKVETVAA